MLSSIDNISLDFDEYSDIVGPGPITVDHVRPLVDRHFADKELLLCIIESVTVGNQNGIGHTHLRMHRSTDEAMNLVIDQYHSIVQKTQAKYRIPLSGYQQWYERYQSAYIVGHHDVCSVPNRFTPWWANKRAQDKPGRSIYVSNSQDSLSPDWIEGYLRDYVVHLDSFSWFKHLPHYVILVKPLSLHDDRDGKWLPLGNLYCLFGFAKAQPPEVTKDFVNKHMHVWLRNYGAQVTKELSQRSKHEAKAFAALHLPNRKIHRTSIVTGGLIKLPDLYKALFDGNHDEVISEFFLQDENNLVFSYLPDVLRTLRNVMPKNRADAVRDLGDKIGGLAARYRTAPKIKSTSIEGCLPEFAKRLSMRRVLQTYLLLSNAPLSFLNLIRTGNPNETSASNESVIQYLVGDHWIPYPKDHASKNELSLRGVINVMKEAAPSEKQLIHGVYRWLKQSHPDVIGHSSLPTEDILGYSESASSIRSTE